MHTVKVTRKIDKDWLGSNTFLKTNEINVDGIMLCYVTLEFLLYYFFVVADNSDDVMQFSI